jgi:peptide/nickel transport system substrate-binding protein
MKPLRSLSAAAIAAAVLTGLLGCAPGASDSDEPASMTIAIPGAQLQVAWSVDAASLWFLPYRPVYEALITWDDEKNTYAPSLAKEYEISEDGLSISFTLREDVVFSDGTKMDAAGVVKALNASMGEGGAFQYLQTTSPLAAATGEYTLEITNTKPLYNESLLLIQLTTIPILAPAAIDDPSLVEDGPIGTGPYLLDEVVPEVSVSYVRNPNYWNPDAYDFDEMTIMIMGDKVAALNALKSGQIDAAEIDASLAAEAETSGLNVSSGPSAFSSVVIADRLGENNPALGDVRVRQALSYSIDREAIVEQLERGYGNPSSQPFDSHSREYVEGGDDRYAYNPEKARELLAEAGYPDGFTIKLPHRVFSVTDYMPALERYFNDIGVTIDWVETDTPHDLALALEVDGIILPLIYSNVVAAFSVFNTVYVTQPVTDPVFLAMMDRYNSADEHDGVLDEITDYILEQSWYIVISHPETIWASTPEIDVDVVGGLPGAFLPRLSWFHLAE